MGVAPQLIEGGRAQTLNCSIYSYPKCSSLCASSGYAWERTSENSVMKLSEKSRRCLKRGLTGHCSGTVWPFCLGIPAKSTLGALLKPLFRQFHGEVQHSPGPEATGSPPGERPSDGYYVSYVHIDRLVVFYIRNPIAQDRGAGELRRILLPRTL